ncbi:MAG: hypothetical protein HY651_08490 [Acidobacteria bacterium]|nr:hypothetical protein [Acidobacteriota bacterium]
MGKMTGPQKLLLLFLAAKQAKIDPIRIMKGQFILAKETPAAWLPAEMRYEFVPYSFGPCSFQIYSDLDWLEHQNLITAAEVPDQSWKYYVTAAVGNQEVQRLRTDLGHELVNYIAEVRNFVDSLDFRSLLTAVYRKYPDYAVKSVFRS